MNKEVRSLTGLSLIMIALAFSVTGCAKDKQLAETSRQQQATIQSLNTEVQRLNQELDRVNQGQAAAGVQGGSRSAQVNSGGNYRYIK